MTLLLGLLWITSFPAHYQRACIQNHLLKCTLKNKTQHFSVNELVPFETQFQTWYFDLILFSGATKLGILSWTLFRKLTKSKKDFFLHFILLLQLDSVC